MKVPGETYSTDEIKQKLAPLFGEERLQFVLLFGSLVSKRATPQSDIDLAFLFDGPVDILTLTNKVIRLLHTDRVDVINLRHASLLLRLSATKQGLLLYERTSGLFNSFYSLTLRMYIDTKEMRQAQSKAIKSFLEERGLA